MSRRATFSQHWEKITGAIIISVTLLGSGYSAGCYQESVKCDLDKNVMVTEYQSKLREELNKQKECETNKLTNDNKSLTELINILKKNANKN